MLTVFMPPIEANNVEKRKNSAIFNFGALKIEIKYKPTISDVLSYIKIAEVLMDIGDVSTEFYTI